MKELVLVTKDTNAEAENNQEKEDLIKQCVEQLNKYLMEDDGKNGRVEFGGNSVSVRVGKGDPPFSQIYCEFDQDNKLWKTVELGYPNKYPPEYIMKYAENAEEPTNTVYGYVPIELLAKWIIEAGNPNDFHYKPLEIESDTKKIQDKTEV